MTEVSSRRSCSSRRICIFSDQVSAVMSSGYFLANRRRQRAAFFLVLDRVDLYQCHEWGIQ